MADTLLQNTIGRQPDRVLVVFGLQELVDLGVGKGGIGAEVAAEATLPVTGHDRFEHVLPAVRRMDVARAQRTAFEVAELVEHEQRMIAGTGEVTVVGCAFLTARGRTDAETNMGQEGPGGAGATTAVDPLAGEIDERGEVLATRQPLGLEPPHLTGRSRFALD